MFWISWGTPQRLGELQFLSVRSVFTLWLTRGSQSARRTRAIVKKSWDGSGNNWKTKIASTNHRDSKIFKLLSPVWCARRIEWKTTWILLNTKLYVALRSTLKVPPANKNYLFRPSMFSLPYVHTDNIYRAPEDIIKSAVNIHQPTKLNCCCIILIFYILHTLKPWVLFHCCIIIIVYNSTQYSRVNT